MLSGKHLFIALCLFILILNSSADAIPALNGGSEPDYSPGTNTPSQQALMRDDADLQGEWNCLVILIDFEDYPWDNQDDELFENEGNPYSQEHFEAMLFSDLEFAHPGSQSEYTGSMRDYYNEISREDFTVTGIVTEWYRAPNPFRYYCNGDGEFGTDDDYGKGDYPRDVHGLAEHAILAANENVDYSDFDNDGDGFVDALFIVHAGPGSELFGHNEIGANYIWSHKGTLRENELFIDDVAISEYAMQGESGAISVFCHEFGHLLGLPDLYDIDYSTQGIGEWGLMGGGGWCYREGDPPGSCPSHMCAWSKLQLDWVDVIDVTDPMRNVEIPPVEESGIVYRIFPGGNDNSTEYFLLENRRRIGFDSGLTRRQVFHDLPAPEGLLITHIDESQLWNNQGNRNENHRLVDVEEASVVWVDNEPVEQLDIQRNNDWLNLYLGNRGDNGDLWPGFSELAEDSTDWTGGRERGEFGTNSVPSTILYNEQPSRIQISEIQFYRNYNVTCNIQVDDRGPCLIVNQWSVNDDEGGNGNRLIEPGETVDLRIELKNIGEDPATDITAIIGYEGNSIEVLMDSSIFRNMESGETATSEIMFQLRIPEDIPHMGPVEFLLMVTSAEEEWELPLTIHLQKFSFNPVFAADPNGWDSLGVQSPSLIIENDTLKCWYVGWRGLRIPNETSIGFAYSLDGGITWRKRNNPVLEADLELVRGGEVTDVAVIHINDLYLMVISSHGGETNGYKEGYIWRALSVDGINWEMLPERIINNLEGWYNMPICNSQLSLYYDENDDEVHLAFAAVDYRFEGAGIAVASTNDLENWVVHDNPLIRSTGNPDQFDGGAVFSPDITCQDGRYTLLYGGINEREWFDYIARHIGRVGLMTSENGQDFMRYQGFGTGSSILEPEENGDWEERFIYGGRLFEWEGQQRILYCAYRAHEENLYHSPAFGLALGASVQPPLFAPPFSEDNNSSPGAFQLDPAFPNPFNSMTTISYGLQHHGQISLQVYNPLGQKINTLFEGYSKAGVYSSSLVADNLPSGLYFIQLETSGQVFTQKVMLIR